MEITDGGEKIDYVRYYLEDDIVTDNIEHISVIGGNI
jgi:hypothetical protein